MSDQDGLREAAASLLNRAERLDAGEELCTHHWSGDPGYECYCTGCDCHISEERDSDNIPFKKDAYCYECQKTPEEKMAEKIEEDEAIKNAEIEQLKELKARYPDA